MIKIEVLVRDKKWKKYIPNPGSYINKKLKFVNSKEGLININNLNFSILLTGNKEIKYLNNKFRKKNKVTDVLSFPYYSLKEIKKKIKSSKTIYIGDIALNLYKVKKKDSNFKKQFNKLWIHGFLHLLGYRHSKSRDFKKMKKLEDKILQQIKC